MSVTFDIETLFVGTWRAECPSDDVVLATGVPSREDAHAAGLAHVATCQDCQVYGVTVSGEYDITTPGVNMANGNARRVLMALDLPFTDELMGEEDGSAFLSRVLVALASNRDDAAIPTTVDKREGCATFVVCGVREGYVRERLTELHALAEEAARLGRAITWG